MAWIERVAEGALVGLVPFMSSMFEEWPFLRARVYIEAVKFRDLLGLHPGQPMMGLGVSCPSSQSDGMSWFSLCELG